jgi:hypothetical protein
MATISSSFSRFTPSLPAARTQPGFLVTPVMPRRLTAARSSSFTLPKEPEDARITGGTRSLDRRLLALNVAGSLSRVALVKPKVSSDRALPLQTAVA